MIAHVCDELYPFYDFFGIMNVACDRLWTSAIDITLLSTGY